MTKTEIEALKLTPKQQRFFEEYIINLHGRNAGINAGYSKKTVDQQVSRLLSQVKFQPYIQHLKAEVSKRNEVSADYVVKKLKAWLELDLTTTMDITVDELKQLPLEVRQMVTSFKISEYATEMGTNKTIELKFVSKEKAIEMLSKHIGFFDKDNKVTVEGVKMPDIVIGLKVYEEPEED